MLVLETADFDEQVGWEEQERGVGDGLQDLAVDAIIKEHNFVKLAQQRMPDIRKNSRPTLPH